MVFLVLVSLCWVTLVSISIVQGLQITSDPTTVANQTFSYVIIGGGTAGLTVASRLAEIPTLNILVIEAGIDAENDTAVNDPGLTSTMPVPARYDWAYNTTPQTFAGETITFSQGKVLGGSSSINGMDWTRGTADQYDTIERLGNPGWNFDSLQHYMKKAELYHLPNPEQVTLGATASPSAHGFSGRVNAGYPQPYTASEVGQFFIATAQKAIPGLKHNPDVCSGDPNGVSTFSFSIKPGTGSEPGGNTRSSSAKAFIYPDRNVKPNLTILIGHQATSILWSKKPSRLAHASGVEFIATPVPNSEESELGERFTVTAQREVVVSSGTIGSPRILELSGIGDRRILEKLGIETKVDLPSVGTNLQDQALNVFAYLAQPNVVPVKITPVNEPGTLGVGFLDLGEVLPAGTDGKTLVDTVDQRARGIVQAGGFTSLGGLKKILISQAISITKRKSPVLELVAGAVGLGGVNIVSSVYWGLIPQWRGTTHIKSSNPSVYPDINPNYFVDPLNLELYLQANATKLVRKIFTTSPLSQIAGQEFALFPNAPPLPLNATDEEYQTFVKGSYQPVMHFLGSVPMLPREDGGAVDPKLVVYGTANVRVVDASILPIQLSAHLSSTVYGIAEKAVDIIKLDAGL